MELLSKAFGVYETNCYILRTNLGEFIIDAGVDSSAWVRENVKNPLAILNTHGHFDHIWDNAKLREFLQIPIYCPKGDAFMLKSDCFELGLTPCAPDFEVEPNEVLIFMASPQARFKNDSRESQNLITRPPTPSAREGEIKSPILTDGNLEQGGVAPLNPQNCVEHESNEILPTANPQSCDNFNDSRESKNFFADFFSKKVRGCQPTLKKETSPSPCGRGLGGGVKFQSIESLQDSRDSQESKKIFRFTQNDKMRDSRESQNLSESQNPLDSHESIAIEVEFMHFPGHTPGCSVIKIKEAKGADENAYFFSGDFMFYRSIGRCDFPYSSPNDMKSSLEKFGKIAYNATLYPGHGQSTTICDEQKNLQTYLRYI